MPIQREYRIERVDGPYHSSNIVCDHCFHVLSRSHHYEVYEGDIRPNPYPFCTVGCADTFIRERMAQRNALIHRCSDEYDDPQEEATTD